MKARATYNNAGRPETYLIEGRDEKHIKGLAGELKFIIQERWWDKVELVSIQFLEEEAA